MRIASLLPSATEIVCALGLADQLVAVTHECDFPPEVSGKPHVTRNLLPSGLTSSQIDQAVRESKRDVHTVYALDSERLIELAPDIVLTQSLCEVCAVPRSAVEAAVCSMPREAAVVSLDAYTLDEMLASILEAGERLHVPDRAGQLVASLRDRIDAVRAVTGRFEKQRRVFCCEWPDPIYCAGHWVPEQVRIAGGEEGLGHAGEPAALIEWDRVLRYAPEVIVLMPCGHDAGKAVTLIAELSRRPDWHALPAVRSHRVFAVNGSAYFSRPGPRLVDGLELLARILHPELFLQSAAEDAAFRLSTSADSCVDGWEPYR